MTASNTPGPWVADDDTIKGARADGYPLVAQLIHGTASDARLIAAAPDLLEACEQAEYWLAHDDGSAEPVEMLRVLRAALAKVQP